MMLAAPVAGCKARPDPLRTTALSESRVLRSIDRGASVSAQDAFGMTPLTRSAAEGRLDLVRLLLLRGADIAAPDAFGRQAIHHAVSVANLEVIDWLLHSGADASAPTTPEQNTPLHLAAGPRCYGCMELLLAAGARLDARNALGQTPLHLAMFSDIIHGADQIGWLLGHGADASAVDRRGLTVAHYAALANNVAALAILHDRGTSLDQPSLDGLRPVDIAAWNYAALSVTWFASHGMTSKLYPADDPLESAVRRNDANAISWLLAHREEVPIDPQAASRLRQLAADSKATSALRTLDVLLPAPGRSNPR